jgi:ankyrin repeat protein
MAPQCHEITAALLDAAADAPAALAAALRALGKDGELALQHATSFYWEANCDCRMCHPCLRAFIAAGADACAVDSNGVNLITDVINDDSLGPEDRYGIDVAAESTLTLKALQAAGAQLQEHCYLHTACAIGYSCAAPQVLLACGADVHAVSSEGLTTPHEAALAPHSEEVIAALVAAGGSSLLNAEVKMGCDSEHSDRSALHLAAARGLTSNVKALLQLGAAVNEHGWSPASPLHLACARPGGSSSSANVVKLLLAHKLVCWAAQTTADTAAVT